MTRLENNSLRVGIVVGRLTGKGYYWVSSNPGGSLHLAGQPGRRWGREVTNGTDRWTVYCACTCDSLPLAIALTCADFIDFNNCVEANNVV